MPTLDSHRLVSTNPRGSLGPEAEPGGSYVELREGTGDDCDRTPGTSLREDLADLFPSRLGRPVSVGPGLGPSTPLSLDTVDKSTRDEHAPVQHGDGGLDPLPPKVPREWLEPSEARLRVVKALEAGGALEDAERIRRCGNGELGVLACDHGHPVLVSNWCNHRLCPDCQPVLAAKASDELHAIVDEVRRRGPRVVHGVFTAQNVAVLTAEHIRELFGGLGKVWRRRGIGQDGKHQRARVVGLAAYFECPRAEGGGFNPHIHCIFVLAEGRFDYGQLERDVALAWHGVTGCSQDCEVKRLSFGGGEGSGCRDGGSFKMLRVLNLGDRRPEVRREVDDLVQELAKYVTKPLELAGESDRLSATLADVALAIKGRRLRRTYGILYGVRRKKEEVRCRRCREHNERVREAYETGTDPGPDYRMLDPLVGYVEGRLRFIGGPQDVWWSAKNYDQVARRAMWWLYQERPDLWGEKRGPPD